MLFLTAALLATAIEIEVDDTHRPAGDADRMVPGGGHRAIRVLLVGGGKHHDFPRWFDQEDRATLTGAGFEVSYTEDPAAAARALADADVLVFSASAGWEPDAAFRAAWSRHRAAGKGIIGLHAGLWRNWPDWPAAAEGFGLQARGHDPLGEYRIAWTDTSHPLPGPLRRRPGFLDERYRLEPVPGGPPVRQLATSAPPADGAGEEQPVLWVVDDPAVRMAGLTLGHDGRVHTRTEFRHLLIQLVRWAAAPAGTPRTEALLLHPRPAGVEPSADFAVFINGEPLDLIGCRNRYGSTTSFGSFDFAGEVEVEVRANWQASHSTSLQVLPAKYDLLPLNGGDGTVRFRLDRPAQLTFTVINDYWGNTLHLFANPPETDVPDPTAAGVTYFGPGYHEIDPAGDGVHELRDGETVYLAPGAFVVGALSGEGVHDVTVRGRGILAQGPEQSRRHGLRLEDASGIRLEGIVLHRWRDGWNASLHRSDHITVHNVKVVSPVIWSTDGINLLNCQDVRYTDCFFRTGDDCIAIKGFGARGSSRPASEPPSAGEPNRDIDISGCIFWSDNNNAVVLGQETKAAAYENITVRDSDVLFVRDEQTYKAALAIVQLNATPYRNIRFENIRVGRCGQLIAVFATETIFQLTGNQDWPGRIEDVTFRNIEAAGAGSRRVRLDGWSAEKPLGTIRLENITIDGRPLTADSPLIYSNGHVEHVLLTPAQPE